jgi:hypothetical protein
MVIFASMNVQESYEVARQKATQLFFYKNLANELALLGFKKTLPEKKNEFLTLLRQVCKETSSVYHFFDEKFEQIQEGLVIQQKYAHYLLKIIPAFLEAEDKARLLQYEVLDYLQRHKLAITRNFQTTVDVQGSFDLYSKYLACLYSLGSFSSIWFQENTYEANDRQELLIAMQYVWVLKLRISVLNFKNDLKTIAEKARNLSKKISYFVEFLGVEIMVDNTDYELDRLGFFDELAYPTFRGNFNIFLHEYLAQELADTEQSKALSTINEAVLAHDLGIALQHYNTKITIKLRNKYVSIA